MTEELWRGSDFALMRQAEPRPRLVLLARAGDGTGLRERATRLLDAIRPVTHPRLLAPIGTLDAEGLIGVELPDPGGTTLRARLRLGPLTADQATRVVADVAAALGPLHAAGLIHRSVCPELILLTPSGAMLCPGEAVSPVDEGVFTGQRAYVPSPPTYAAPEVLHDATATSASDCWALGVVLYESLQGRLPIEANDPFELASKIGQGLPTLPRELGPELGQLYGGLTDLDRTRRWTADRVVAALRGSEGAPLTSTEAAEATRPQQEAHADARPTAPASFVLGQQLDPVQARLQQIAVRPPDASASAPVRVLEHFELRAKRASGGFATVYEGWDQALGRRVAIKILDGGRDPGSLVYDDYAARFERERRVQVMLGEHPNIVRLHQAGEHEGHPVLVLEFVDGPSLAEWAKETRPTEQQIASAGAQIAAALAHAHARNIVHRDVKPSSILADGARERVKLGDFGIAQIPLESERQFGLAPPGAGTRAYSSPEQELGAGYLDARSDVYSLGCTLHEFATGVVYKTERRRLEWLRPDLSRPLIEAIDRCIAEDPDERYQRADELAKVLRRMATGVSGGMVPGRWRRPLLASLLLAGLGAAVALGASCGLFDGTSGVSGPVSTAAAPTPGPTAALSPTAPPPAQTQPSTIVTAPPPTATPAPAPTPVRTPAVRVVPPAARGGTIFVFQVSNFPAGQLLTMTVSNSARQFPPSFGTVAADGTTLMTFNSPQDVQGLYSARLVAGGVTVAVTFQVTQ